MRAERVARSVDAPRLWPLLLLNFFMADMQSGIGPFVGVFLLGHGWTTGLIGVVMTIGAVAGTLMTVPVGAAIDVTRSKRVFVIIPGICTVAASAIILVSQNFWVVAASQVAVAIAGSAIVPAVVGITLGIVRQSGFNRQNGRNQAFNHAGNLAGAALSGYLGWRFGYVWVFWLAASFGVVTIVCALLIPAKAINDRAARGLKEDDEKNEASGFRVLVTHKPLLILAAAMAAFQLGAGAMLPLYSLAVVSQAHVDGASFVATTIVIAQGVMILSSLAAIQLAEKFGYWITLLLSFVALPVRGLIAANVVSWGGAFPVEILDGLGAGLQSVAIPGMVARTLHGTGRINAGQGAVLAVQGIGASLSPAIGGWIAQGFGYGPAFLALGAFSLVSIAFWVGAAKMLNPGVPES